MNPAITCLRCRTPTRAPCCRNCYPDCSDPWTLQRCLDCGQRLAPHDSVHCDRCRNLKQKAR